MHIHRIHFPTIPSTNTWAKENVEDLDSNHLTIITADEQTAGRGRYKREWISPKEVNLYITFVLFKQTFDSTIGNLAQLLALSVYETVFSIVPTVKLKWPNDIVIKERKLGGILTETVQIDQKWAVIIGLGLNINMTSEWLGKIDRPATSLLIETGQPQNLDSIKNSLIIHFQKNLLNGFDKNYEKVESIFMHKKNDPIQVLDGERIIFGTFEHLNRDGSITIKNQAGELIRLFSGELV